MSQKIYEYYVLQVELWVWFPATLQPQAASPNFSYNFSYNFFNIVISPKAIVPTPTDTGMGTSYPKRLRGRRLIARKYWREAIAVKTGVVAFAKHSDVKLNFRARNRRWSTVTFSGTLLKRENRENKTRINNTYFIFWVCVLWKYKKKIYKN